MARTLTEQGILQRKAIRLALATLAFKRLLLAEAPPRKLTDEQRQLLREHEDEIRRELLREFSAAAVDAAIGRARADDGAMDLKLTVKGAEEAMRRKAETPAGVAEMLAAGHAERIGDALRHIGRGSDVLQVLLAERAGPGGVAGSDKPTVRDPATSGARTAPRSPTAQAQNRPAGRDPAREQGEGSPVDAINLREVLPLGRKEAGALLGESFRSALLQDASEAFGAILDERVAKAKAAISNPQSCAHANAKELTAALIAGASELVDKAVAHASVKEWERP